MFPIRQRYSSSTYMPHPYSSFPSPRDFKPQNQPPLGRFLLEHDWLLRSSHMLPLHNAWQAREGLGGGFNERQDRASVATVEVDEDGFDDFGRKKIKARADQKAKEVSPCIRIRAGSMVP